jgi:hypothetical protein
MVLDEVTGEVINLKVFITRTKLRSLGRLPNTAPGHKAIRVERFEDTNYYSSRQKRKAEGIEVYNSAEKKFCR